MNSFETDLKRACEYHGHLCGGQVIGVRMARMALSLLGIDDPAANRDLISFVEADRCLADAVGTVTGCTVGRRRLKMADYGKMAATFWDSASGRAVRIHQKSRKLVPEGEDPVAYLSQYTDEELFAVDEVSIELPIQDMPGRPVMSVVCSQCGELVLDKRHVEQNGQTLCRACHGGAYYQRKP